MSIIFDKYLINGKLFFVSFEYKHIIIAYMI